MKNGYSRLFSLGFLLVFFSFTTGIEAQPGNVCSTATTLPVNIGTCTNTTVSNAGYSDSGAGTPTCSSYNGGDVWLKIVVPASQDVTVTTSDTGGGVTDTGMEIYSGSCGSLTVLACDDDGGAGGMSQIHLTNAADGITSGETLYVRVFSYDNAEIGSFGICAMGAPSCTSPSATFSISNDCANNQFSVVADVTSLGSASSVNITSNGSASDITGITSTGTYTIGPFSSSENVTVSVVNADDSVCKVSSTSFTGDACPIDVTCGTALNQTFCYQNNQDKVITYHSLGGSALTLTFNAGGLEACCDVMTIYDGASSSDPVLYTSTTSSSDLTGVTATSTGPDISIRIVSDNGGSCSDGFISPSWDYTLSCPVTVDCSSAIEVQDEDTYAASQVSENLANAIPTNVSMCNSTSYPNDMYFRYTAVTTTTFIEAKGTGDFDAAIEVYDNCANAPIMCQNNAGPGALEQVVVPNQVVGQEYYYRVYHVGSSAPSNTNFSTAVAHVPFVQLRNVSCGQLNLTPNSVIYSSTPSVMWELHHYEFKFTELEAPYNTYEVISPNGNHYPFLLSWFPQLEPGRTYSVSVRVQSYLPATWGDYGPACTIGVDAGTQTSLAPQFDNQTFSFCDLVFATPLGSQVSQYRFVFDDGVNAPIEYTQPSYNVVLKSIPGLQYNTTYTVNVYATLNGQETTTSTPRTISLGGVPQTQMNNAISPCGATYSMSDVLYANNVCKATSYEWKFSNTTESQNDIIKVRQGGAYNLALNSVPGLIAGDSYDVSVRALFGSSSGVYGSSCNITIAGSSNVGMSTQASDNFQSAHGLNNQLTANPSKGDVGVSVQMFPNPNDGNNVRLTIDHLGNYNQSVAIDIYDLTGKRVFSDTYPSSGSTMSTIVRFDKQLSSGIYMVKINGGTDHEATSKLFVRQKYNRLITIEKAAS